MNFRLCRFIAFVPVTVPVSKLGVFNGRGTALVIRVSVVLLKSPFHVIFQKGCLW
jgi:hypothetical protein